MQNMQSPQPPQYVVAPGMDERLMAVVSHLSFFVPHAGIVVPLIIWLLNQEKAPYAAYQSKQALFFHLFVLVAACVLGIISFFLVVLTLGLSLFVLIPLWAALELIPIVLGIIGAIQSYEGRDFRYPFIGSWMRP